MKIRSAAFVSFVLVPLVLMGAGCAKKSPEKVLKEMPSAMVAINSADYRFSFAGNPEVFDESASSVEELAPGVDAFELAVSGQFNREDALFGESAGDFKLAAKGEGGFSIEGSYIGTKEHNYFQLSKLSGLESLGLPFDISGFLNKWVVTPKDPEAMALFAEAMEDDVEETELTEAEIRAIEKAFQNADLFQNIQDLGEEEVEGNHATKYQVQLDKEGILAFMQEASDITGETVEEKDRVDLGVMIDALNAGTTMLWIGIKDNRLYRIVLNPSKQGAEGETQQATIDFTLFNFNGATNVQAPEEAVPFEQLLGGGLFGDANQFPGLGDESDGGGAAFDPNSILDGLEGLEGFDQAGFEEAMKQLEGLNTGDFNF